MFYRDGNIMKIVAKPIDMVAWFDAKGVAHPIKFRMMGAEGNVVIKVDRIITREFEKLAGSSMLVYKCQSVINGVEKVYELKFEMIYLTASFSSSILIITASS